MQSKLFIESLEDRRLLSGSTANAALIGPTSGVTASAKAKVTAAPQINVRPRTMYFNAVRGTTNAQTVRITNEGNANLDIVAGSIYIRGSARARFTISGFPASGVSIKPGRRLDLTLTYSPRGAEALNVQSATLVILSTDPVSPALTVGLRALPTAGIGGEFEPSLQRVIDTFGLPINVGDATPEEYQLGTPLAGNDEVLVQRLVKAGDGPVSIRPLAVFGTDNGPAVRVGTYTPGIADSIQQLWYVPRESAQSVNPLVYGQTLIDPGNKEFALAAQFPGFTNNSGQTRNVFSEDTLNNIWEPSSKANDLRKMRFYPFIDQNGNVAPNTYLVAVEEYTKNYDQQDVLFIISNVKPATNTPVIAATNLVEQPTNDRLVFNKVEIPDPNYPNATHLINIVRIRNTGTSNLVVTVKTTGNYTIDRGGGTNVTIAPGAQRDVQVRFTATSGKLHNGTLDITSNDPDHPLISYKLVGYWQQYSEFNPNNRVSLEPSAKVIVNDIMGFSTILTKTGQSLSTSGRVARTGEEILSPYWRVADDGAPVRVTQLAAFHNQTFLASNGIDQLPTQTFLSWFVKGKPTKLTSFAKHAKGDAQSVLPRKDNSLSNITAGSFIPQDQVFGFVVENHEFSDPTLNPDPQGRTGYGHFVRFWPAFDNEGKQIPNTYIMLHDYNREFTNFDFNDNIYLVQNIIPENALKSPLTVFTEETSKGARISFTSPATGPKIIGFRVYRSATARGTYELLTDTPLARRPVTTFIDETVTSDQTFYYKVVSLGLGGLESDPVTVKV